MDSGFFDVILPIARKVLSLGDDIPITLPKTDLEPLIGMPRRYGQPLLVSSFFGSEDRCIRTFYERGVPVFDSPEKAAKAMAAFHSHLRIRNRKEGVSPAAPQPPPAEALNLLQGPGQGALDEYRAKRILAAYGIPVTREILVRTLPEAAEAAGTIGYPVVLKGCSPEILHKTEQGMVFLDLKNEDEMVRAFRTLRGRNGEIPVLVAEMLRGDREFMAGMTSAPGFPPCILFGLGGVFAEALKDHQVRLAPLCVEDAFEMMDSLQSRKLLTAYRGMKAVNRESLASLLAALGRLALDFPAIREMDLNPILIVDGEPRVVDALIGLLESRWLDWSNPGPYLLTGCPAFRVPGKAERTRLRRRSCFFRFHGVQDVQTPRPSRRGGACGCPAGGGGTEFAKLWTFTNLQWRGSMRRIGMTGLFLFLIAFDRRSGGAGGVR
jgi:acetyltransferase